MIKKLKPATEIRFIRQINESSTIMLFVVLDILCVTYFLTSIIMPDPQTSDMRQMHKWCNVSASSGISSP